MVATISTDSKQLGVGRHKSEGSKIKVYRVWYQYPIGIILYSVLPNNRVVPIKRV